MQHQSVNHTERSTSKGTMMKICFVLILVLADAASLAIDKRIVGGKSCDRKREYHVEITSVQEKKSCGGALLNTRWVITASHCAERRVELKFGLNVPTLEIVKELFKKRLDTKQVIEVNQQFTFKDEEGNIHDIMLIKLNKDISPEHPIISLPQSECKRPELNQEVKIGSRGLTVANAKKSLFGGKQSCATTKISACGADDKPVGKYFSDESTTMCAFKPGVEACYGDAGTAVTYDDDLLHGIIVSKPVDKCANPIVMLDICRYLQWIEDTMRNNP